MLWATAVMCRKSQMANTNQRTWKCIVFLLSCELCSSPHQSERKCRVHQQTLGLLHSTIQTLQWPIEPIVTIDTSMYYIALSQCYVVLPQFYHSSTIVYHSSTQFCHSPARVLPQFYHSSTTVLPQFYHSPTIVLPQPTIVLPQSCYSLTIAYYSPTIVLSQFYHRIQQHYAVCHSHGRSCIVAQFISSEKQ